METLSNEIVSFVFTETNVRLNVAHSQSIHRTFTAAVPGKVSESLYLDGIIKRNIELHSCRQGIVH